MKLYHVIVAMQIIEVYSSRISLSNDDELLTAAAATIVNECFASSERWSEVELIVENSSTDIVERIQHESMTTISMVSINTSESNGFVHSEECNVYLNTSVQWKGSKPIAVVIDIRSVKELESVLSSLKTDVQRIWRPRSYFLIILEAGCNSKECNEMFKIIWDYWILNAIILCTSYNPANRNYSEIQLYTFNPFSADHSPQWEIKIHETIEVPMSSGNFDHSWYIFEQRFTEIQSSVNCDDLFFDKTLNLDGFIIPISSYTPDFVSRVVVPRTEIQVVIDSCLLRTIAEKIRFHFAQASNYSVEDYGQLLQNGSYTALLNDVCTRRSHIAPNRRGMRYYRGVDTIYPHDVSGMCIGSWIIGNRPQWANLADAKVIWIALGVGLLFFTLLRYLQNKSRGIASAFLDAERLIIGSSLIHMPTTIKHRIILGSIFLMVLVIDGAFRGRLISILTVVRSYSNPDTLEEITEQNIAVYGHPAFKEMIPDPQIVRRYKNLEFPACLNDLQSREYQRVCFADCEFLRFGSMNSSDVHIAPTPILTSYITFVITLNWPLKNRYSFEVQKLVESGILERWKINKKRELDVNTWKLKRAEEPPFVRPIKLNDLLLAFILLFMGLLAALVTFLWEMRGNRPSSPSSRA